MLTYDLETGVISDSEANVFTSSLREVLGRRLKSRAVDSPLHESLAVDFSAFLSGLKYVPPQHKRHQAKLVEFQREANYHRSVLIMTKFPEPDGEQDRNLELNGVVEVVRKSVESCGYRPRVASDREYYDNLWDNVELYLLGCSRGIAIVEGKYDPEMNPNIAMEWGWMRGAGKRVLFLVEQEFKYLKADWHGLLRKEFNGLDPSASVPGRVRKWLRPSSRQ